MKMKLIPLIAWTVIVAGSLSAAPLKVYILVGQSNMQGHAMTSTLPYMADDPATRPLLAKLVDENGKIRVYPDVHVAAFSGKGTSPTTKSGALTAGFGKQLFFEDAFGPELGFGVTMYDKLEEPILIIKTAWGGKSLSTDFRSPSAGPYELPKETKTLWDANPEGGNGAPKGTDREKWWEDKRKATGVNYRWMIESVKEVLKDPAAFCSAYDAKQGYELAGMVWFQGFNDMIDSTTYPNKGQEGRYALYTSLLSDFIRDVRKDLSAPKMPVVIGVMGIGGTIADLKDDKTIDGVEFRKAMAAPAAMPEFKGNVFTVRTGKFWDFDIAKLERPLGKNKRKVLNEFEEKYPLNGRKLEKPERKKRYAEKWAYHDKRMEEILTKEFPDDDVAKLMKAKANAGYHYLGCGKTLACIGEAFAEALLDRKGE